MQNTKAVIWFAQQIFTFLFPSKADCSPVLPRRVWAWPCSLLWPVNIGGHDKQPVDTRMGSGTRSSASSRTPPGAIAP